MFDKREGLKPPKERRQLPPSPYTSAAAVLVQRPTGNLSCDNINISSLNNKGNSNGGVSNLKSGSIANTKTGVPERGFSSTLGRNKYDIVDYDVEMNSSSAALMLQVC